MCGQSDSRRTDVRGPSLRTDVCEQSTHGLLGLQDALFPRALELTGAKDGKAFSNSDATIRA